MTDFRAVTDEQLKEELRRRGIDSGAGPTPTPIENPDWTQVKKLCCDYIAAVEAEEPREDLAAYIMEAAIQAVFGQDIFERWINKKIK